MIGAAGTIVVSAQRRDHQVDGSPGDSEESFHVVVWTAGRVQHLLRERQSCRSKRRIVVHGYVSHHANLRCWVIELVHGDFRKFRLLPFLATSFGGKKLA